MRLDAVAWMPARTPPTTLFGREVWSGLDPYALFTAAPSLIFNENESEALRDSHESLQWAVLLFNVFSFCSAHETLGKYLSMKF